MRIRNDGNPKLQNCTSANSAVHAMGLNKYGQTSVVSVSTKHASDNAPRNVAAKLNL